MKAAVLIVAMFVIVVILLVVQHQLNAVAAQASKDAPHEIKFTLKQKSDP